jgi:ABC-2 type transport system ATP-binding protein
MVGGQKYPLLLNGPGFGLSRIDSLQRQFGAPAGFPLADIATAKPYIDAGYGVVAFDQRGFGQSTGNVTIMDPDQDGRNLVQIVDWMQVNLDWAAYRDGNLLLGAYGGSYGGGYQLLLNNIDPRRRLDAIVPSITWYDLSYSLNPGNVPKSGWALAMVAAGEVSSGGEFDPRVRTILTNALVDGRMSATDTSLLRYHSNRYFCEGISQPGRRTARRPPPVDALLLQGMHDVLFNLNEAKANYDCLSASGGDVRLLTYNVGHVLPAGVGLISNGLSAPADAARCGPYVADAVSRLWFDAKLKRDATAITALQSLPEHCVTISSTGEGVVLSRIPIGGTAGTVPATTVAALLPVQVPVTVYTATETTVVAGIPRATLSISNPVPSPGLPGGLPAGVSSDDAIVFVSLGLSRAGLPSNLEPTNDQVRPLRGFGTHVVDLNGIGVKLQPGDQIQVLLSSMSLPQFPTEVARNPLLPAVTVSGTVSLPVLGNVPTLP